MIFIILVLGMLFNLSMANNHPNNVNNYHP